MIFKLFGVIGVDTSAAEKGLDALGKKLETARENLSKTSERISSLGKGLTVGITAPLTAFATAAVLSSEKARNAFNSIQAELDVTEAEAEALQRAALNVFNNNFGDSVEDATAGLIEVRKQIKGLAQEDLQFATESAFALRDAFGVELTESTNAVNTLIEEFGLTAGEAFDFVTAGFQQGLNASGDFLDTIGEYSVQFAAGGANAEQFYSLIESGLQAGVLGTDKAADAFKEFRLRIQDGSEQTSEALKAIGIDTEALTEGMSDGSVTVADAFELVVEQLGETEDPLLRLQSGTALLGTQFEDLGDNAATGLSLAGTSLDDLAGSTDKLSEQYDNLANRLEAIRRRLQSSLAPLGSALVDILETNLLPALENAAAFLTGLGEKFGALPKPIQNSIISVGAAVAALGPLLIAAGAAVGAISNLTGALPGVIGGIKAFSAALSIPIGPLGLVVAAVGLVVAAFATDFLGIRTASVKLFNDLKPVFENITEFLSEKIPAALGTLKETFGRVFAFISDVVTGVVSDIRPALNILAAVFTTTFNTVNTLVDTTFSVALSIIRGFIAFLQGDSSAALDFFKAAVSSAAGGVSTAFTQLFDGIRAIAVNFTHGVRQWGVDIVRGIIGGITSQVEAAKNAVGSVASGIAERFRNLLGISSPSKLFDEYGRFIVDGVAKGLKDNTPAAESEARNVAHQIASAFLSETDRFLNKISQQVDLGFINAETAIADLTARYNELFKELQDLQEAGKAGTDEWVFAYEKFSRVEATIDSLTATVKANTATVTDFLDAIRDRVELGTLGLADAAQQVNDRLYTQYQELLLLEADGKVATQAWASAFSDFTASKALLDQLTVSIEQAGQSTDDYLNKLEIQATRGLRPLTEIKAELEAVQARLKQEIQSIDVTSPEALARLFELNQKLEGVELTLETVNNLFKDTAELGSKTFKDLSKGAIDTNAQMSALADLAQRVNSIVGEQVSEADQLKATLNALTQSSDELVASYAQGLLAQLAAFEAEQEAVTQAIEDGNAALERGTEVVSNWVKGLTEGVVSNQNAAASFTQLAATAADVQAALNTAITEGISSDELDKLAERILELEDAGGIFTSRAEQLSNLLESLRSRNENAAEATSLLEGFTRQATASLSNFSDNLQSFTQRKNIFELLKDDLGDFSNASEESLEPFVDRLESLASGQDLVAVGARLLLAEVKAYIEGQRAATAETKAAAVAAVRLAAGQQAAATAAEAFAAAQKIAGQSISTLEPVLDSLGLSFNAQSGSLITTLKQYDQMRLALGELATTGVLTLADIKLLREEIDRLEQAEVDAAESARLQAQAQEKAAKAAEIYSKKAKLANNSADALADVFDFLGKTFNENNLRVVDSLSKFDQMRFALGELASTGVLTVEQIRELSEGINELEAASEEAEATANELTNALTEYAQALDEAETDQDRFTAAVNLGKAAYADSTVSLGDARAVVETFGEKVLVTGGYIQAMGDTMQGTTGTIVSGAGSIVEGFGSVINAGGSVTGIVGGIGTAATGLNAILGALGAEAQSAANKAVEGFIGLAGSVAELATGIPGLGAAIEAVGQVFSRVIGDLSNGAKQVKAELADLAADSLINFERLPDLIEGLTRRESRGGILGFFGATKQVFDEELLAFASSVANAIEGAFGSGFTNAARIALDGGSTEDINQAVGDGLRETIEAAVLEGLQSQLVLASITPLLTELTAAIVNNDTALRDNIITQLGEQIPVLTGQLQAALGPLSETLDGVFGSADQSEGLSNLESEITRIEQLASDAIHAVNEVADAYEGAASSDAFSALAQELAMVNEQLLEAAENGSDTAALEARQQELLDQLDAYEQALERVTSLTEQASSAVEQVLRDNLGITYSQYFQSVTNAITQLQDQIQQAAAEGLDTSALEGQLNDLLNQVEGYEDRFKDATSFLSNAFTDAINQGIETGDWEAAKTGLQANFRRFIIDTIVQNAVQAALATEAVAAKLADLTLLIQEAVQTGDFSSVQSAVAGIASNLDSIFGELSVNIGQAIGSVFGEPVDVTISGEPLDDIASSSVSVTPDITDPATTSITSPIETSIGVDPVTIDPVHVEIADAADAIALQQEMLNPLYERLAAALETYGGVANVNFDGATFEVREEADIDLIADAVARRVINEERNL